ncbi:hypothetical protein ACS0TY_017692 [Phlomoides rotata]
MGEDHCFLPGGNGRLVQVLVENVPIQYEKTVQTIRYGSDGMQFIPKFPQRKLDAIRRLGFGLLIKVALLFPHAFWGTDLDTFGHLCDHSSSRDEFFLFYSYATVVGGPLLIALVAGEAAYRFEKVDPTDSVRRVLRILRALTCMLIYGRAIHEQFVVVIKHGYGRDALDFLVLTVIISFAVIGSIPEFRWFSVPAFRVAGYRSVFVFE